MSVKRALSVYGQLKALSKATKANRIKMLKNLPDKVILVIYDIAKNILNGKIHLKPTHLAKIKRYKKDIRSTATKQNPKQLRKTISQRGGALPALLIPALGVLANLIASRI